MCLGQCMACSTIGHSSALRVFLSRVCCENALQGYAYVPPHDDEALMEAVYSRGTIAVSLDASQPSFRFYASGALQPKPLIYLLAHDLVRCCSKPGGVRGAALLLTTRCFILHHNDFPFKQYCRKCPELAMQLSV